METGPRSRAPELRKDNVTNRWVIFSPARAKRPSDFKSKNPTQSSEGFLRQCPFCIGREHECAPEIFRVPDGGGPEWKIRVIQNLYPALDRDLDAAGDAVVSKSGGGSVLVGFGFHDVVIETPLHSLQLGDLEGKELGEVILAYKRRIEQIARCEAIKYVQVFKNYGASAGASMSHSHSQIIALPIIPPLVLARLGSMKEYFSQTGKCCLCEVQPKELLINESIHFIAIVPFAATFPFEMWIIPREHSSHFHEIDSEKAIDLGGFLKLLLKKMSVQLNDPPFNYMIYTSPLHLSEPRLPHVHWFLQIVPQLTVVAGFEIGTGCHVNPVLPEDAAKVLREVSVPLEK